MCVSFTIVCSCLRVCIVKHVVRRESEDHAGVKKTHVRRCENDIFWHDDILLWHFTSYILDKFGQITSSRLTLAMITDHYIFNYWIIPGTRTPTIVYDVHQYCQTWSSWGECRLSQRQTALGTYYSATLRREEDKTNKKDRQTDRRTPVKHVRCDDVTWDVMWAPSPSNNLGLSSRYLIRTGTVRSHNKNLNKSWRTWARI